MFISKSKVNGLEILIVTNRLVSLQIVPALGGKIISVYPKEIHKELLWFNQPLTLKLNEPGVD